MPKFIVTQAETMHVRYLVEGTDAEDARETFYDANDTVEIGSICDDVAVVSVELLTEELPKPRLKIIEAADTLDGRIALTIEWNDGSETVEIVGENAAALLGYRRPDEAQV